MTRLGKRLLRAADQMNDIACSGMSEADIIAHCPEGRQCKCLDAPEPWKCRNWGRSTLGCPAIIGRDPQYGGSGQKVNRGPK